MRREAGDPGPGAWAEHEDRADQHQQKFKFILLEGNKVGTKTFFSPWGYTIIDLGIVKYHFEVGAGKDQFVWVS